MCVTVNMPFFTIVTVPVCLFMPVPHKLSVLFYMDMIEQGSFNFARKVS